MSLKIRGLWRLLKKTSNLVQKDLAVFEKKCSFRLAAANAGNERDTQVDRSEIRKNHHDRFFISSLHLTVMIFHKSASNY